ncbi:hypothetical protein HJC23_008029 [Cyclotella cryptica]|uniref:Uncharacterized protein n=1 Tax=Cyclotella cryptica TaxID=29204 RepID=A0ABD3Q287_9STRA
MSTNIHTKKYDMLEKQSGVALLIHDVSKGNSGSDGEYTTVSLTGEYVITLNGTCSVIYDGRIANFIPICFFLQKSNVALHCYANEVHCVKRYRHAMSGLLICGNMQYQ